jgi:hypothetical protein
MVMLRAEPERFWSGATMRTSPKGSSAVLRAARPGEETPSSLVRTIRGEDDPRAMSAQSLPAMAGGLYSLLEVESVFTAQSAIVGVSVLDSVLDDSESPPPLPCAPLEAIVLRRA